MSENADGLAQKAYYYGFKLSFLVFFCQLYYSMDQEMNEAFNGCALFENSPLDSPSGVTPGE